MWGWVEAIKAMGGVNRLNGRQERERHSRLEVGGLVANHIRLAIAISGAIGPRKHGVAADLLPIGVKDKLHSMEAI